MPYQINDRAERSLILVKLNSLGNTNHTNYARNSENNRLFEKDSDLELDKNIVPAYRLLSWISLDGISSFSLEIPSIITI